jgi:glucose dehydrogenase
MAAFDEEKLDIIWERRASAQFRDMAPVPLAFELLRQCFCGPLTIARGVAFLASTGLRGRDR